jgi:uncharacterized protein YdaU (DUF1376 family)
MGRRPYLAAGGAGPKLVKRYWMPLNIGDYLAETGHLSAAEHGAYHLLRMYYWIHSRLPAEEDAIRRISRMTPRQWLQSRDVLKALFSEGWRHLALDLEIRKAIEISEVNSANARKSHANRKKFAAQPQANPHTQQHLQPDSLPSGESSPPSPEVVNNAGNRKSSSASGLDPNWTPNAADEKVAGDYGMSQTDISSELAKFRAHHAEKGFLSHDWSATWLKWCSRWDGKPKPIKPSIAGEVSAIQKVHVKVDTPQWEAWQTYCKNTTGKGTPTDKSFGWQFDSEWPPGHPLRQEDAAP